MTDAAADMRDIIGEFRRLVVPTAQQAARAGEAADTILERVGREAARHPQVTGVELGGSYGKGTWLALPEADIDVYVVMRPDTDSDQFERIAIEVGYNALGGYAPYKRFSDHPYVEARIDGNILANVVPCYDVAEGKWVSAADRSRFHTAYMNRHLTEDMRCDVRLLKAFLRANGMYGAQIERRGFSGYVAEVLVAHYGSFEMTVRGFAGISPGAVIGKAAREFGGIVSIIDPVDGNRNLAAAISRANLVRFVLACRAFTRRPSAEFFGDRGRATATGRAEGGGGGDGGATAHKYWQNMLVVRFGFEQRAPDVIWGQAAKSASKLAGRLERGGFAVVRYRAHVTVEKNVGHLFVLLGATTIPPVYVQQGPPFDMPDGLDAYIQKHLGDSEMMWIDRRGRLAALRKREDTGADSYARRLLEGGAKKDSGQQILPGRLVGEPVVWIGSKDLDGTAAAAAEGLIRTDAAIIHLG